MTPTLAIASVYHVGSLDPADKGTTGYARSWEGHGLSVSPCPAAWERIARLGGQPWWQLDRPDGLFADAHVLDELQRAAVSDWAVENGYARRELCFYAKVWDDELNDVIWLASMSRRGAIEEAADRLGCKATLSALKAAVSEEERLVGLEPLDRRLGFQAEEGCFDFCLVCYVEDTEPDIDGVWWEDSYGYLSAPRGVILPGRLNRWQARKLDRNARAEIEGIGEHATG